MKRSFLIFAVLCFAAHAAYAQEVTVRMTDDASKSITLDERMTQETVWKRFGIYATYNIYDDTCFNGDITYYETEDLEFSC